MNGLQSLLLRSSWVILYLLVCGILYEQGLGIWNREYETLSTQLTKLNKEKELALMEQKDLQLRVNSQSDPAWVELILMRELGLAPEEQVKVVFQ
ncbi:MAG: hypothetical protein H7A37_09095 [Chlamydiales bacterium]|nr:hypothetical protein [Chlamydiia bacterium]MCP5508433.1 hypothetical protein [Chlamydiales bacterium]